MDDSKIVMSELIYVLLAILFLVLLASCGVLTILLAISNSWAGQ